MQDNQSTKKPRMFHLSYVKKVYETREADKVNELLQEGWTIVDVHVLINGFNYCLGFVPED